MNKYKIFIIVGVCILIATIGGTLAWYVWKSTDSALVNTETCTPYITFTGGANITGANLVPVLSKESGIIKNITVKVDKNCDRDVLMNLYLKLDTMTLGLQDSTFVYELYKSNTLMANGNFSTYKEGDKVTLLTNAVVNTTKDEYTLYIYLDGNKNNPTSTQNQSFSFSLYGEGVNAIYAETAAQYITRLYNEADKTKVTNNNIEYNYATLVFLMNDRLGGTTKSIDAGNIRYYGRNPNNYIYFNCNDYNNQSASTCELWRIIGVFDDKVKIIRNKSIGSFSWDNKLNTKNDWTTARLMKLLNPSDYYTVDPNDNGNGQSLYWNSDKGTCFSEYNNATTSCDFTSTGIKDDTKNKIAEVSWNLGHLNVYPAYSNQMYEYERETTVYDGNPTSWTGKIALIYPSDYGYATDFTKCTGNSYNESDCKNNDWLYNNETTWWSLSPYTDHRSSSNAWYVSSYGHVNTNPAYIVYGVRPVLFLSSEQVIESGNGSSSQPYRLGA